MPRFRGVWLALVASVLLVAMPHADQQPPFQTAVDLVRLPVVVLDRLGDPVRQLTQTDFEVFENGQRQTLTSFAEGPPTDRAPLHLGLMLDTSASMERDIKAASNGAVKFVTMLDEARDVTFVDFDTGVRLGRFGPDSYPYLFERIRGLGTGRGRTALYDALGRYVQDARAREGLHLLVLYSDGGDSMSRTTLAELLTLLRQGQIIVYAIGYLDNQSGTARGLQQSVLARIAHETGGEVFFPSTAGDLDRTYEKIFAEIQGRYTIGYVSSDARRDGRFRKVEVRLSRDNLRGAKVRTRSGYVAE